MAPACHSLKSSLTIERPKGVGRMLDRRNLLATGASAAACAALSQNGFAVAAEPPAGGNSSRTLAQLFDAFVAEQLNHAPEATTSLGLDTGQRAYQRSQLGERSLAEAERLRALVADQLKRLQAFRRSTLNAKDQISYDVVLYGLKTQAAANRRYAYAGSNLQGPYILSQLTGSYQQIPDFLDSQHPVNAKPDADAYMARLDAFARVLDEETEFARHDVGLGVIPPDFVLARALTQMSDMRKISAADSVLVQSIIRRTKEKNIAGDYG